MNEENSVLTKMGDLLAGWETASDRRMIFLHCYRMMTSNIMAAIEAGYFEDNAWVKDLMENFAGYYFRALEAHEFDPSSTPQPWQIAFQAASSPQVHVLQNLILGVNAHINYDLVFSLADLLGPLWERLPPETRMSRYRDYTRVNDIINRTIDPVQDQVVERFEPVFDLVDRLLGPMDEWVTSLFIASWRDEVWDYARQMCECTDASLHPAIIQQVEQAAMKRAREFLGRGNG